MTSKAMKHIGGKMLVFGACIPSVGELALKSTRDNPRRSGKTWIQKARFLFLFEWKVPFVQYVMGKEWWNCKCNNVYAWTLHYPLFLGSLVLTTIFGVVCDFLGSFQKKRSFWLVAKKIMAHTIATPIRLWCPLSFSVHKVYLSPFLEPWSVCMCLNLNDLGETYIHHIK